MQHIIYKDESYKIIGACLEVHNELGSGFAEPIYQESLAYEFKLRNIPFIKEKQLNVRYKDILLEKYYVADFICYDKIIVETKALSQLLPEHEAQVLNYLKATGFQLGLLINFGEKSLVYKRFANTVR
jgi:GxxExxY protein